MGRADIRASYVSDISADLVQGHDGAPEGGSRG